jgi:RNA polymerase sigma-70 factor, ECF subfamily
MACSAYPRSDVVAHLHALQRIATRESAGLEALYDETSAHVFGLARRMAGGDGEAAEAITLDVYSQVWERTAVYAPRGSPPLYWLLALTRRCALETLRAKDGRSTLSERAAGVLAPAEGGAMDAADPRAAASAAALEALPAEQRAALELASRGGFTVGEVAGHLGLEPAAAARLLRDGLAAVRSALARA